MITALVVLVVLSTACGSNDETATSTTTTASATSSSTTTVADSTTTTVADATTTTAAATTSTSAVVTLEQPAIWPAADVVFDSPEAAAHDFVSSVFGVPPELGEFQQGDGRSGEIEVLPPAETDGVGALRSVLLLRQLGPDNGWFVIGAINENNVITSPESIADVAAGSLEVSGEGRGFEGALVVEAFLAGDANDRLDQQIAQGGSTEATEPYSVTVDLSGVDAGQTVMLLVRGGVGLDTDPGEFSAIPVVVG